MVEHNAERAILMTSKSTPIVEMDIKQLSTFSRSSINLFSAESVVKYVQSPEKEISLMRAIEV